MAPSELCATMRSVAAAEGERSARCGVTLALEGNKSTAGTSAEATSGTGPITGNEPPGGIAVGAGRICGRSGR